jgi:hypothetical protein
MADQQAKLKKRLEALLKLPDNTYCADCKKRGKFTQLSSPPVVVSKKRQQMSNTHWFLRV